MPATSDLLNRPCVSEAIARQAREAFPGDGQKQQDMREAFLRGARAQKAEDAAIIAGLLMAARAAVTLIERTGLNVEPPHTVEVLLRDAIARAEG